MSVSSDFEAALERAAQPLNDYSKGMTALTLANISRNQQIGDVAEARRYQEGRDKVMADQRSKDRREEIQAMADRDFDLLLAKAGLATSGSRTDKEKRFADWQQKGTTNTFKVLQKQKSDKEAEREKVYEQFTSLATQSASKELKVEALKQALRDPALDDLPKAQRKKLEDAVLGKGDPDSAVDAVSKYMGSKGWFTDSPEKARKVLDSYYTPLAAGLDKVASLKAVSLQNQFNALDTDVKGLNESMSRFVRENADRLPQEFVDNYTKENPAPVVAAPPADPNEVFKDAPPKPPAAAPAGVPQAHPINTFNDLADITASMNPRDSLENGARNFYGNQAAMKILAGRGGDAISGNVPPTAYNPGFVQGPRTVDRFDISKVGRGLPELQPGEAEKVRALAPQLGITDEQWQAGDQRLRALQAGAPMLPGDDRIVQGLTIMLNMIRQNSAPLPTPGMTQ